MSKVWLLRCAGNGRDKEVNHVLVAITPQDNQNNTDKLESIGKDIPVNSSIIKDQIQFYKDEFVSRGVFPNQLAAESALIEFDEIILSGSHTTCPHCMIDILSNMLPKET